LKHLEHMDKTLGEGSPASANIINNIANIYYRKADYEKAKEFYGKAYAIYVKALEPNDLSLSIVNNNMGNVYRDIGEYDAAQKFYDNAYEIAKLNQEEGSHLSFCMSKLASLDDLLGRYKEGLENAENGYKMDKKFRGDDNSHTMISLAKVALFQSKTGKIDEAKQSAHKAIKTMEGKPKGVDNAYVFLDSGRALAYSGETKEAIDIIMNALNQYMQFLGDDHPSCANCYFALGEAFEKENRMEEAMQNY